MRCSKAQARINAGLKGRADEVTDRDVREHLAECASCADLERARHLIAKDLDAVAADAGEDIMGFEELQKNTAGRSDSADRSANQQSIRQYIRRYAIPAAAALVLIVVAIVSSLNREPDRNYDITVAGIDESMLLSGSLERLFDAVGLPDVKIVNTGCDPTCLLKIVGLHNLDDTRLAVAALQAVPSAEIQAIGDYVDKNTGQKIYTTVTASRMDISENRWAMELQIDSTVYDKVILALDSLKKDTTFTITSPSRAEDKVPGLKEDYTVHPDGSYSTTLHAIPTPGIGWTEDIYTYDSTGNLISHTMVDTSGKIHEIDFRNWANQEEQLKALGMYSMITYDDAGTPHHTGTNVDPTTIPGYGPRLEPGMALEQNEPNPFDTLTNISFTLPEKAKVKLTIYNLNSQPVRTLIDSTMDSGEHTVTWKARSDDGSRVWSRVFLAKLQVGEYYHTIMMYQVW